MSYIGTICHHKTRDLCAQKATEAERDTYRNHLEELVHARTAEMEPARDEAE